MLRAERASGSALGKQVQAIMDAGKLVSDDIMIALIASQIAGLKDKGFILDGFPRTVPQAQALDDLLKKKHIKLDAVVELRVNESALLQRVETRVAEMRARGEEVRIDDTPEVLSKRLASYRSLTEPLIHYYSERRKLLTVDGMMTIEHVTREIYRILGALGVGEAKAAKKSAKKATGTKRAVKTGKAPVRAAAKSAAKGARKSAKTAKKAVKAPGKAGKPAPKGPKKPSAKASAGSRARAAGTSRKPAKKVTKRRAKA
jgi:adenylate kinase